MSHRRSILAASLGNDVHVAGVLSFLKVAEEMGYETTFLGPATRVARLVEAASERPPTIIAVSYRLSPEPAAALLKELRERLEEAGLGDTRLCFGGTPAVADVARESGLFEAIAASFEITD